MFSKVNVKDMYSLSPMQEGMLFHYIMDEKSTVFFEQMCFKIRGKIDTQLFEQAFKQLVERYDVLRTVFVYKKVPKPRQVVLKTREASVYYKSVEDLNENEKIIFISNFKKENMLGIDLSKDIAMKFSIIKISENEYEIVWLFHHIIIDGWCTSILLKELFHTYDLLSKGKTPKLPPTVPYSRYIKWLEKQDEQQGIKYWKAYLEDYKKPAVIGQMKEVKKKQYSQEVLLLKIDKELSMGLNKISNSCKVTLSTTIQTIWGVLLQKHNNTNDVVFASVVSGRPLELTGVEKIIGLFMNTIPLRIKSEPGEKFKDIVIKIQKDMVQAKKYEYMPLVTIQSYSELKQKLLNHVVIFENYPLERGISQVAGKSKMGFSIGLVNYYGQANYDLEVFISPGKELCIQIKYNYFLYDEAVIVKIEEYLINIIKQVVFNPEITIDEIGILSEKEKQLLLYDFNQTKREFPKEKTVHKLIEEQVKRSPDKIAVKFENEQWTYKELNERANRLARVLRNKGVERDQLVGIFLKRTPLMVESILAVWKAKGAYIPINLNYPDQRILGILNDSKTGVLISLSEHIDGQLKEDYAGLTIALDKFKKQITMQAAKDLDLKMDTDSLAYVIYTSGSTGRPKGVMVEHIGMMNHIQAKIMDLQIKEKSVIAQNASHCFDISVWQFFAALNLGGRTTIYSDEIALDPIKFLTKLIEDKVTIVEVVPSNLITMLDSLELEPRNLEHIEYLVVTGDVLKPKLVKSWFEKHPGIKIVNAYGPTEASDDITHYIMDKSPEKEQIPIGKPIQNLNIYITDENMRLCPLGAKGEICVSGVGVGRGYLYDEEKTQQVFMKDPFSKEDRKLYKTGDLGRWTPNGNIEFFGRLDHQVKIRGFRIELGEIEKRLLMNDDIKEAIVVEKEKQHSGSSEASEEKYLCAYYVSGKELTIKALRDYLSRDLPDYMIPSYFMKLEKMPITVNGKIDRKSLPEPDGVSINTGIEYDAPETEMEKILVGIWEEVLGVEKIGVNDDYFTLGGDSIKAIQIASRLYNLKLKFEMQHLFKCPTIRELSKYIKQVENVASQETVEGYIKLTPIQHWFFENNYTEMHHINQSVMFMGEDGFNETIVKKTFQKIVEHHDVLRMVFKRENGKILQINQGITDDFIDIQVYDLREKEEYEKPIEEKCNQIQSSIDLSKGPLLNLGLFKTKRGDYLLIVVHHLVMDGVSWRILFEDFALCYNLIERDEKITLPLKTTSFREWAEKLYEYSNTNDFLEERSYWKELEETSPIPLSKDRTTKDQRVLNSKIVSIELSQEYTKNLLQETNRAYNTEINDILLAALALALEVWTGKKKAILHLEGHGREEIVEDVDISRTIGWFTALYPVILNVKKPKDLAFTIKKTKEMLRHIPNKGIGYGILKYLSKPENKSDITFQLQPEIKFNYLGQFDQAIHEDLFRMATISSGTPISLISEREYVLDIWGIIRGGSLRLSISFNRNEYDAGRISALLDIYKNKLESIIEHCIAKKESELTLSDFSSSMIDAEEVETLFDVLEDKLTN